MIKRNVGISRNQAALPLFPKFLYGDAAATRAAWRRFLQRAWKAGGIGKCAPPDMVSIADYPGEVIIYRMRRDNFKRNETHWWPLWVSMDRPARLRSARRHGERSSAFRKAITAEQEFILDGMKHFWFAVGMLGGGLGDRESEYRRVLGDAKVRDTIIRPMLRQFVTWLPMLVLLRERFACCAIRYCDYPVFKHRWFLQLLVQFHGLGYKGLRREWTEQIDKNHDGDIIEALVAKKWIGREGDRLFLHETC
ncbi:MAG TPA: hypothetical protein VMV10_10475 [Pirellulales bacterium]|nr:hypothetical protein [Pirellulales bacterium]